MNATRLHIGSGPQRLEGWINLDNQAYTGVDRILDVTLGLPFRDVEYVFAEHFIEHLPFDDALNFARECRRVLRPDGVLRLSTPDLDWVIKTHYHPELWTAEEAAVHDCFVLNRAFRGWGHQFLYNTQALEALLVRAGFADIEPCRYGESRHEALRGLERHEKYPDAPHLPHILIVDASGVTEERNAHLDGELHDYYEAIDAS